jgi:predicted neuraminidase
MAMFNADAMLATLTIGAWRRLLAGLLGVALVLMLDTGRRPAAAPAPRAEAVAAPVLASVGLVLQASGAIPMPVNTPAAHASSLLTLPKDHAASLMAFWFAGTRESAPDVQIAASQFDRASGRWTPARFVLDRQALGADLGFAVRRLGNPVAWLDPQGRIHLFVVATGLGGWAAARIVHLRQRTGSDLSQLAFAPVQVLPLGWLWNTSFLVRNAPLPLADGGMVLPVYFELGIKYPLALRFGAAGQYLGATRISARRHLLQPSLLPLGPSDWLALMRDQRPDGRIGVARTQDGGHSWQDAPDLGLVNPGSAVASLALAPGQLLLVHNSLPGSRHRLDLSQSVNGEHWALAQPQALVEGLSGQEFSYPALTWADDSLWVSYTDQRRKIAWQRFAAPALRP